jgi:hypothetical protein
MNFEALSEEFPHSAISWRAQSVTKDGTKALALAYIDARDVMDRLDQVCGPENWQDRYEFHGPRTICYLSLRVDGEWITKADGAGDSDVEAEKGAISDALKRSAVKWGIGRYLYHIVSPWVPCETTDYGGKKQWKKWAADPWDFVRSPVKLKQPARDEATESLWAELCEIKTNAGLKSFWTDNAKLVGKMDEFNRKRFTNKKDELKAKFEDDHFPGDDNFPGDTDIRNVAGRKLHTMEGA